MVTVKPSDLILMGFQFRQETHQGKHFTGHRLRIRLSDRHIRIRMMSCSCAFVQTNEYTLENLKNLLDGLKVEHNQD